MYQNFGDRNFFDYGMLVDTNPDGSEYQILACLPFDEEKDRYLFGDCTVDISESWIDRKAVMHYIGMTEDEFDPICYAIGCMAYYDWENFGANHYFSYDWRNMKKADICEILKHREIDSEGLNICW